MQDTPALPPAAATEDPAAAPTPSPRRPLARVSERLSDDLVEAALDSGRDPRPGRETRADGWTPDRIRIFLHVLAECGVVADAARAAGMSLQSAYNLRKSPKGRAFSIAWSSAEQLARRRISSELISRAIHGCVEVIVRDGEVWGERHRYDNRLTLAVLANLDRKSGSHDEDEVARLVGNEFDGFVDIVAGGGDGAADFIESRQRLPGRITKSEAGILRHVAGETSAPEADADDSDSFVDRVGDALYANLRGVAPAEAKALRQAVADPSDAAPAHEGRPPPGWVAP